MYEHDGRDQSVSIDRRQVSGMSAISNIRLNIRISSLYYTDRDQLHLVQ